MAGVKRGQPGWRRATRGAVRRLCLTVALLACTVGSAGAADQIPIETKRAFLQDLCAGLEQADRCMNMGNNVIKLSLDWVWFEACSFSGERPAMATCLDRAMRMAEALTGDPQYAETYKYCHRFQQPSDDLTIRCYREGFKYSQRFIEDKYRYLENQ